MQCQAVNVASGKLLFESPGFGGGTGGKSCKTCDADGRKLSSKMFGKDGKKIRDHGQAKSSLAEVVDVCMERPRPGKAIDPEGDEMIRIISSLATRAKYPAPFVVI